MAERIEVPPTLQGDEKAQLQQVWSYLYQLSEAINNNLDGIGGNELTDSERKTMQMILSAGEKAPELSEAETLKSLIIKTADFVQTNLQEYRMNLLGETVASGKFGRYVRSTGLDVAVTPEGIMQNYSFQEIIQGLKVYEINAKNYIKTGLLRTVSSIPVYGVAIGKDVVTFSEDGTETYNDGNKVAELTADELSFWQNGVKVAGYTGSRISFYYNGTEAFYIQNGKIYCTGDLEITAGSTLKVSSGGTFDVNTTNFKIDSNNKIVETGAWKIQERGLVGEFDNGYGSTNFAITMGRYGTQFYSQDGWTMSFLGDVMSYNSQVTGAIYLSFDKPDPLDPSVLNFDRIRIVTDRSESPKQIKIIAEDHNGYINGELGNIRSLWDLHGNSVWYNTLIQNSSKNIKHDIRDMLSAGEKLDRLRPVTFVYDDDADERQRMGLIYEEAMEVMPEICTQDESNKAISYIELVPALLKEIQELRKRVAELERRVDDVQGA